MAFNSHELRNYYNDQIRAIPSGNVRNKSKGKARIPLAMMARDIKDGQHFGSERLSEAVLVEPGVLRRRS